MYLTPCYIIHNPIPGRTIRQLYTDLEEARGRVELENSIEAGDWSIVTAFFPLPSSGRSDLLIKKKEADNTPTPTRHLPDAKVTRSPK